MFAFLFLLLYQLPHSGEALLSDPGNRQMPLSCGPREDGFKRLERHQVWGRWSRGPTDGRAASLHCPHMGSCCWPARGHSEETQVGEHVPSMCRAGSGAWHQKKKKPVLDLLKRSHVNLHSIIVIL